MFIGRTLAITMLMALGACVPPMSVSHQHVTEDGRHWGIQLSMSTGVAGTPVQTAMVIYNKYQRTPIAIVQGSTFRLEDRLLDAILALEPSVVQGQYMLEAERINCPPGTICGMLVQVSNRAGAQAGANSATNTTNN